LAQGYIFLFCFSWRGPYAWLGPMAPTGRGGALRRRCAALLLAALPRPGAAFDLEAHDAIGQTVASAMDQAAIKQVKRLLDGQDASDVAGWGHQVDDTYPGMERLHFQIHNDKTQPFCGPLESREPVCEDGICLLVAIKHFYGRILKAEGRKTDFPAIDYNKAAKGVKFSDADAVKMLINLLGDLHQPMHVGYLSDNTGRDVEVRFRGKNMSLYAFWDTGISEVIRQDEANFWLGGWTHVGRIREEFEKDTAEWKKLGAHKMFDKWAAETVAFACKTAYTLPQSGKKLAGPDSQVQSAPVEISNAAYATYREAFLRQVLLAGERTAVVLNDILDAKGAASLHQGTAVKTKADAEAAKQKAEWAKEFKERAKLAKPSAGSSPPMNWSAFFTNLSIALIVVPTFILMANYGINPRTYQELMKSFSNPSAPSSNHGKRWE